MRTGILVTACTAAFLLMSASGVRAGGPFQVSQNGRPYVWDAARPISYVMDAGPLGHIENARAVAWVEEAFRNWASVEGVGLTVAGSRYDRDITGENVLEVLDTLPLDVSPIIFDADGSVLDTLFGAGTSQLASGKGGPWRYYPRTARIAQGIVILNGVNAQVPRVDWWRVCFQHEVGHLLGLAHTQVNTQVKSDGDAGNDHLAPCMSYSHGPNARPVLHAEDRAWIRALYPMAGAAATTGTIRGRVLFPDGRTGLQGIQVVARRDGDEEVTVVSGLSGERYKRSDYPQFGGRDVALQGLFELPGLPPGNYRLSIEPVAPRPELSLPHVFLPGGRRFWRESGPLATLPEDASLVTVSAGSVVEGRDFVLDGPRTSPREVKAVTPAHLPELAQTLSLPAVVSGRVGPRDPRTWHLNLPSGTEDGVEAWHRLVITEPTTVSATLEAEEALSDLSLYLVRDPSVTMLPAIEQWSGDPGTPPETIQTRLLPGVYYLGVSFRDGTRAPATDYRLTVVHAPSPDLPAEPAPPRMTLAVVSHLTSNGLRVRWQTDRDANAILYAGFPWREIGSPALAREHVIEVPGLAPRMRYNLLIHSRGEGTSTAAELFDLTLFTPAPSSGGEPLLSTGLWSIQPEDEEGKEFLLVARVTNVGDGLATGTRIERIDLPAGWSFVAPPPFPIDLGEVGAGSSAVVAVRASREPGAAPPDLRLLGRFATPDRSVRAFE